MKGAGILMSVIAGPIRAYSIQLHWTWFLTPVVKITAPSLGICYGLMLTAMLLTFVYPGEKQEESAEAQLKRGIFHLVYGCCSIVIGYIVHLIGGAA
jgi:hypothetical protein